MVNVRRLLGWIRKEEIPKIFVFLAPCRSGRWNYTSHSKSMTIFSWELHTQESDKRKKWRLILEGSDGKIFHRQFCQMTFCEFRHPGMIFIQLNNFFPLWLVSRVGTITEIARWHEDRKTFFSARKSSECALKSFQTIDSCNWNFFVCSSGPFWSQIF